MSRFFGVASRATKFTYTYVAAPRMDWCIGVLVYFVPFLHRFIWGKRYILRRDARRGKARILEQVPRARQRITYLLSSFPTTELVHR